MPGLLYPGNAWSLDMGHSGKGHTSLQRRPSLKELIAFPEVRVTNPSLNRNPGSISQCPLQLKPSRTLQGLSGDSFPNPPPLIHRNALTSQAFPKFQRESLMREVIKWRNKGKELYIYIHTHTHIYVYMLYIYARQNNNSVAIKQSQDLPSGSNGKEPISNAGDLGLIPGLGRSTGEGNDDPHCSILAWRIPCTEEPGGLQFMGLQRVGHN